MSFEITQEFTFDCAHFLTGNGRRDEYSAVHGHSFVCAVTVSGLPVDHADWVVDFAEFKSVLIKIGQQLDHKILNDIPGLETPTMENICVWIASHVSEWLTVGIPADQLVKLISVKLMRKAIGQSCVYRLEK